jgi:hypothetical protein
VDPFTHTQIITFDVNNLVPSPPPPLVTVDLDSGGYLVSWEEDPGGQAWDDDYAVAEVWRDDCTGSQRIATVQNGLSGSYLDLAIPQLDPQPQCEVYENDCDLTYSVRYWGYVTILVTPELRVSDFDSVTVPGFTYDDYLDRLATTDQIMAVATDRTYDFPRSVADSVPLQGGLHSVSTTPAGEDVTLTIGVEGILAINELEDILSSDLVYYSPVDGTSGWFAPTGWTVRAPAPDIKVVQVLMVHQPWPTTPEPAEYL